MAAPHLSLLAVFGLPAGAASTFIWRTLGCAMALLLPTVTHSLKAREELQVSQHAHAQIERALTCDKLHDATGR